MRLLLLTAALAALIIAALPAHAERRETKPTWQARKLAEVRAERDALRREVRVLRREHRRSVRYAIRLAASAYGVPASELWAVADCETGGTFSPVAKNSQSSAAGLFQFLDTTWRDQGMRGFSVYDPVANALAAARIVRREGWSQWECKP